VQPSAKGVIVVGVVASLRKLRRTGALAQGQLSARLSGAALELLEQKVEIGRWYPMAVFAELVDFEWEVVAKRSPDYARAAGAKTAERQFESGRYQQLDFARRASRAESRSALLLQARLITTITAAFYSFVVTSVSIDPARPNQLEIVYAHSAVFPELLRYATEGFMNEINRRQGSTRRWTSGRPAPDRLVYRMELPAYLAG
jgi:hypothetical protein